MKNKNLHSNVQLNKINHINFGNKQWHLFQIGNEDNQPCQQLSLITKPKMINSFQQQQSQIIPRNIKKQINQCQFCSQRFKNHKALGGHISKKHKGSSKKYNQKMRSYKRNTQTRFNRRILTKYIRSLFGFEEQVDQ
uniref:MtC protein n=1 Tax=Paramecium septaurelia TaxID=43139 RepID=A0A023ZSD7_9CILI|nr:mtC protein [Paramecium septaurelia]